jgi:MFS-type transporter involved in bile tolerance (Atg22 family)
LTASKSIRWPGGATSVAVLIIGLNSFANVIPTVPSMISFLPWYLIIAIFPALIADLVLKFLPMKSNVSIKKSEIIAGAIIGCVFYMFSYPMITWVFSIPLGMNYVGMEGIEAINNLTSDFKNSFVSILALTMIPGALMGILGTFLASDKIYSSPNLIHEESHSKNHPNIRRIGKKGD